MNDFARATNFFRRFPQASRRGLQQGLLKAAQPVKKAVQESTKAAGWPSTFKYTRQSKSQNLHSVVIRKMNRLPPGSYGVRVIARHMGPSMLMEHGSAPIRKPVNAQRLRFRNKKGKWIYPKQVRGTRPKRAWKRAAHQVENKMREIDKIIMAEIKRMVEKEALKAGLRK